MKTYIATVRAYGLLIVNAANEDEVRNHPDVIRCCGYGEGVSVKELDVTSRKVIFACEWESDSL